MFKAIARYFAGAPSPEVKQAEARAKAQEWEPGEPVLSILRAYWMNRARFTYGVQPTHPKLNGYSTEIRTLVDTQTGISFTVSSTCGVGWPCYNELYGPATGLNLQETIWLLQQVGKDRTARNERLKYLLGKRKRDRLCRLYVK